MDNNTFGRTLTMKWLACSLFRSDMRLNHIREEPWNAPKYMWRRIYSCGILIFPWNARKLEVFQFRFRFWFDLVTFFYLDMRHFKWRTFNTFFSLKYPILSISESGISRNLLYHRSLQKVTKCIFMTIKSDLHFEEIFFIDWCHHFNGFGFVCSFDPVRKTLNPINIR